MLKLRHAAACACALILSFQAAAQSTDKGVIYGTQLENGW